MATWIFEPGHTSAAFRARHMPLQVIYHGQWKTPFWLEGENKGEITRAGFEASTSLNRHDCGVSWQGDLPGGGLMAGAPVSVVIDVEAMLLEDLERRGAIEYDRQIGAVSAPAEN